jgi:hypothetical protein
VEGLQAGFLEQPDVVGDGHAPLLVVIGTVHRWRVTPTTSARRRRRPRSRRLRSPPYAREQRRRVLAGPTRLRIDV